MSIVARLLGDKWSEIGGQDMDAEKKAELLMDHYKETFQLILYHWKVRNRLFIYILIILALVGLDSYSPGSLSKLVNAYITHKVPKAPTLGFDVIGTAAWFLLLSLVIQYYQRSIFVDRQYHYIQRLEEQICSEMGGDYVTREGKAYFSRTGRTDEGGKQPVFIRGVGPIYVYAFPILLIAFVMWKLIRECCPPKCLIQFLNIAIGGVLIAFNVFYVMWVKWRR